MNGTITNSKKDLNQPCIIADASLKPEQSNSQFIHLT